MDSQLFRTFAFQNLPYSFMKNSFLRAVAFIALSAATLTSVAVTKDEMEQARTIAAKTYLRWANEASGYLDGVQAKTMDQLKGQLKAKELENLKAFNKVQVPTDYASWDKDKLVHFWSVTFFNSPELSDAGKRGKSRVGAQIKKLTISDPSKETPAPAEEKKAEPAKPAVADQPAAADPAEATAQPEMPSADEAVAAAEEDTVVTPEPRKRESSNTAVYVAILAVLVAVVVALVVYAVNSMKESGKNPEPDKANSPERKAERSSHKALEAELSALKAERDAWRRRAEKAEKALSEARDSETRSRRQAEEQSRRAEADARELMKRKEEEEARRREREEERRRQEEEALAAEARRLAEERRTEELRREEELRRAEELRRSEEQRIAEERRKAEEAALHAEELRREEELRKAEEALREAEERRAAAAMAARRAAAPEREKGTPTKQRQARTIYLGRVNSHGIFVRADREPVIGYSFFALTTSDGMSGSFSVIDDPEVFESALADPEANLINACTGHNLLDTLGATEVITEQSGTAVFEGHCWKVARKARIAYE